MSSQQLLVYTYIPPVQHIIIPFYWRGSRLYIVQIFNAVLKTRRAAS